MGKKATHKCVRAEGSVLGSETIQGPVPKSDCVYRHTQLNSGSLHKQTRRNPLGRDVCFSAEKHNLLPSLHNNTMSQTHSSMPKCDGRLLVQISSEPIKRMVPTPSGVQADVSKVVHSSYRPICHSSEKQASMIHISSSRPTNVEHRCSEYKLLGLIAYTDPPLALLHKVIPRQLPVSTTLLKQSHSQVFHNNPQYFNLHA